MKGFRHLRFVDRVKIEALVSAGKSVKDIAAYVGFSVPTIYRELKRGQYDRLTKQWKFLKSYSAEIAQLDYDFKASNKGADLKIGTDFEFAQYVENKIINEKYSPAAVLGELKATGKHFNTSVCVKTLYNYIDKSLFLHLSNKDLLRKRARKQDYNKVHECRVKRPLCRSIENRPETIDFRADFGHWEMDTVIGKAKGKGQVLLVLTERKTRQELIFRMRSKTCSEVVRILNRLERKYGAKFRRIFKTITVDNGCEFMDCEGMEASCRSKETRTTIYYCHPYSSWERGSNENANSIIRRFIPKGSKMEEFSNAQIEYVEHWINNYPRRIHNYKCSNVIFTHYLETA